MRVIPFIVLSLAAATVAGAAQPDSITVKEIQTALAAKPQGDEAVRLADRIRTTFGGRNALLRGLPPKVDELTVAWAIELPEPLPPNTPRRVSSVTSATCAIRWCRWERPNVYRAGAGRFRAGRRSRGTTKPAIAASADRNSKCGRRIPTAASIPACRRGPCAQMPPWESKIFKGTKRDWWIYVPAQYRAGDSRGRDGVPGRQRTACVGADGVRQPDREEATCR